MSEDKPSGPLISGLSPSHQRARATAGKDAPTDALDVGVLLRVIEHELALAALCDQAASRASDAAAIVTLREAATRCRSRLGPLVAALVERDGSAPRPDEVQMSLRHDARDLETVDPALGERLAALAAELDETYARARATSSPAVAALVAAPV